MWTLLPPPLYSHCILSSIWAVFKDCTRLKKQTQDKTLNALIWLWNLTCIYQEHIFWWPTSAFWKDTRDRDEICTQRCFLTHTKAHGKLQHNWDNFWGKSSSIGHLLHKHQVPLHLIVPLHRCAYFNWNLSKFKNSKFCQIMQAQYKN